MVSQHQTDNRLLARPIAYGLITFLFVLGAIWKIDRSEDSIHLREARATAMQSLAVVRARLEAAVNSHVHLAKGLIGHVITHPDIGAEEFRLTARQLVAGHDCIISIQLARDTVVSHVYPPEMGGVIGLRLLDIPEQRAAVERTLQSRGTLLAGPVDLVQGGTAFISRTPIYLPYEGDDGQGEYWGLATVLLDRDSLLREGIEAADSAELRLAIRGRDSLGGDGEIFWGDAGIFEGEPLLAEVVVPNGSWQIAAVPERGWEAVSVRSDALWLAGILLALTGGILVGTISYRPQQLMQANRELESARLEAERAVHERSRFLAVASHDVRQPLHALGLFVGELQERSQHLDELRPLVHKIGASVDALTELFDALLDISRLDAGNVRPSVLAFPVGPLLERLAVESAPMAIAKGLRIRVVRTRAIVRSDPVLLERVLRNLVVNAITYTERGGILLGCRRHGDGLRIGVWDTGPGIVASEQDKIFREFYQLGNPQRDRRKGLGLGLAIVRRLAELLGHRVSLETRVGRGTAFWVELERAARSEVRHEMTEFTPAGLTLRGLSVLVVDDDELVSSAMESLLTQWGCEVTVVHSGEQARQLIVQERVRPDLLLCDYRLPDGMTGDRLVGLARAQFGPGLAAFLLSGDTSDEIRQAAEAVDCRLLTKPVTPAKLRTILRNIARRRLPRRAPVG